MTLRLHGSFTSPYVRKVRVLLVETGQTDAVAMVPVVGTPIDPGTLPVAQNPLGKIPTLERDDGPAIYDSRVICRYLDDRFAAGMYPAPPALWSVLTLEATADGMLDAAVTMVYEMRLRDPEQVSAAVLDAYWTKIARSIKAVENRWMGHLAGPLDMGQIALAVALSYLDFRHDARRWRDDVPALAAWHHAMSARPSMIATAPPDA